MTPASSKVAGFRVRIGLLALLLGAACQKQPTEERRTVASAEPSIAAATPQKTTTVQLGFQRIGAPFLLKARSDSLTQALSKQAATASWKEFKTGPALLEAINAKEVDIGYVGETPPVFAQSGGVNFVYVAADLPAPKAEAIIVPKSSPIKTVAELKGKRVALNRGSNVHFLLVKALEKAKLTPSDISVVYLAPGDARPAFETGKVDAWVIWDPFLAAAEQTGARQLVDGEGLVQNRFFYVVRREFAESAPALVRTVLDEYKNLSAWEAEHTEEAAKLLAESSGVAYEALLASERRHPYGIVTINDEVLNQQQTIADTFAKLELIPKAVRVADAVLPAVVYASKP